MTKIKLQTAFAWTCPKCQARLFEDPPTGGKTPAETAEIDADIPWDLKGEWCLMPTVVLCPTCLISYDVEETEEF